jgi:hypothetical protein
MLDFIQVWRVLLPGSGHSPSAQTRQGRGCITRWQLHKLWRRCNLVLSSLASSERMQQGLCHRVRPTPITKDGCQCLFSTTTAQHYSSGAHIHASPCGNRGSVARPAPWVGTLTKRANGSFRMSRSVDFCHLRISCRARVPGRARRLMATAATGPVRAPPRRTWKRGAVFVRAICDEARGARGKYFIRQSFELRKIELAPLAKFVDN